LIGQACAPRRRPSTGRTSASPTSVSIRWIPATRNRHGQAELHQIVRRQTGGIRPPQSQEAASPRRSSWRIAWKAGMFKRLLELGVPGLSTLQLRQHVPGPGMKARRRGSWRTTPPSKIHGWLRSPIEASMERSEATISHGWRGGRSPGCRSCKLLKCPPVLADQLERSAAPCLPVHHRRRGGWRG